MDALLKGWTERAEMMLKQPGLISVQMHRGIAGASILASYVVWESLEAYRAGQAQPDGHDDLEKLDLTMYPVLVQKIAIPGIFVARPLWRCFNRMASTRGIAHPRFSSVSARTALAAYDLSPPPVRSGPNLARPH